MCRLFRLFSFVLLVAGTLLPAATYAAGYRVDVILFTNSAPATSEQPTPALLPQFGSAINVSDPAALVAHGIQLLSATDSGLQKQWQALRYSRNFHPAVQLSWVQSAAASGTPLLIQDGTPLPLAGLEIAPIAGTIALYTGRLLHLDAHLSYNFTNASGAVVSYKLNEVRRVKFDELHYLDSPRLGVLARVTKVD